MPELGPDVNFSYASHKAVNEFKEAKAVSFPDVIIDISVFLHIKDNYGCIRMLCRS